MPNEFSAENDPQTISGEDKKRDFSVEWSRPLGHLFKPVIYPDFSDSKKAQARELYTRGATPKMIGELHELGMLDFGAVMRRIAEFVLAKERLEFLGAEGSRQMYEQMEECLSCVLPLAYRALSPFESIDNPIKNDLDQLFLQAVFLGTIVGKINVEELLQKAIEDAGQKVAAGMSGGAKRAATSNVRASAYKAAFDAAESRGFKRTAGDLRKYLGSLAPDRFRTNVVGCEEIWLGDEKKFTDTIATASDSTVINYRDAK